MKIIGAILVFISSSLLGLQNALKIKFHINDLKKICMALNILESEIEFGALTLYEAAKNISGNSNSFVHEIFSQIAKQLEKKSNCAKNIWIDSINSVSQNIYIDSDDILTLNSFANVISNIDRQLQLKSLQTIIYQLEKKIALLETKYQNEKKLYCNLGILFGILIVIIFI